MQTTQEPATSRQTLIDAANQFLDALERGAPEGLELSPDVKVTENCRLIEPADGVWRAPHPVRYRHVVADPDSGQVAVFAVVEEGGASGDGTAPALWCVGARLKCVGTAIQQVEVLVCREGESSVFDPARLQQPNPLFDAAVEDARRQSRDGLVDCADRYFDGIEKNSAADVPFHVECNRTENGVRTTNRDDRPGSLGCAEQLDRGLFGYIEAMRERRYPVVDVERGLVWAVTFLDVPGTVSHLDLGGGQRFELPPHMRRARSTLLFELFKVVGGELRDIEAFMVNLPYGTTSGWLAGDGSAAS